MTSKDEGNSSVNFSEDLSGDLSFSFSFSFLEEPKESTHKIESHEFKPVASALPLHRSPKIF